MGIEVLHHASDLSQFNMNLLTLHRLDHEYRLIRNDTDPFHVLFRFAIGQIGQIYAICDDFILIFAISTLAQSRHSVTHLIIILMHLLLVVDIPWVSETLRLEFATEDRVLQSCRHIKSSSQWCIDWTHNEL